MEVDNIKLLSIKNLFNSCGQIQRYGNTNNGTAAGNGARFTYGYEPVTEIGNRFRGRRYNLDLMPHTGEITLQRQNVTGHTARVSEIVGRN